MAAWRAFALMGKEREKGRNDARQRTDFTVDAALRTIERLLVVLSGGRLLIVLPNERLFLSYRGERLLVVLPGEVFHFYVVDYDVAASAVLESDVLVVELRGLQELFGIG